ncbi:MAG: hypothetical protein EYC68_13030 [Chloroflexota bacterium]|nr:MAG: hypothetical protein EYC68_13030 [Chloroflexota bacterium]
MGQKEHLRREQPSLQIWLLGQFDVRVGGKRAVIPTRAAQSLFAFLVLNAGAAQRREKLAGLLFPEMPDENARRNLRHALWRVRKAITSPHGTDPEPLLAEELAITFNPNSDYWLDVAQLEKAADDRRPTADSELTKGDSDVTGLLSAVALYRGELLPGFYDDWAALERERVQAVFEGKMQQLLEMLITEQRWLTVLEWAERWIALGQTPEPAYRALMIAHGAQGNMSQVALDYERCAERLREDVGVEPSADTRALYETLAGGGKAATIAPSVPPILLQPSGTVTFLFTDIEGSTKLLERLGNEYATLLAEQRDLLRETAEKYHGHEVDTQGDAFFFAFFRAADAANFATDAQRALATHKWPQGATLRVRMGLHTGEPMLARTGYVGLDVHRAARIGAAGHGGQVLMSRTTRDLVEHDLPHGTRLDDLGEHQLKDLRYPVHIIQLTIEDLPSDFPPLQARRGEGEPPAPGEPPFKGLQYFDERDADLFFGREALTAKLVARLRESKFLAVVVGASGSGKSSVVRAGMLPALRRMTDENWRIHVITPTAHPLMALATELTREVESVTATATLMDDLAHEPRSLYLFLRRQVADSRLQIADGKAQSAISHLPFAIRHSLLVIDQFEELFTLCHDELEREQFVDNLLTALSDEADGLVTLVLTIRADFYAHLAQYPELRDAVARHQEYIGPMTMEELRRAIEEPAKQRAAQDGQPWEFEPGLVDLMLRDVGDEPGALPLLSHALLETWKRRSGHTLTLKGYHDAGGVRGAIAQTAETTFEQLTPEQQNIARGIFLRLTELGEGTEDTRRRASFNELIPRGEDAYQVRAVLTKLADARLITTSADSAEVAHEALIREWDRLREWLNENRDGLKLHRQLTEATREWELLERDPGALYRGARLAQANEFVEANPNALNEGERAFLDASVENEEREEREREEARQRELLAKEQLLKTETLRVEQEQAANMRLRQRAIFLAGAFVLAIALAAIALFLSEQSNRNAMQAEQSAQQAVHAEATAVSNADAAQKSNEEAIRQQRITLSRELAGSAINNLEVDPERSILLAMQAVTTTHAVDGTTTKEAAEALHRAVENSRLRMTLYPNSSWVWGLAFSPDGKNLATGGDNGQVKVWDIATGKELLTVSGREKDWNSVAYSPNGRLAVGDNTGKVTVWDVNTQRPLLELQGNPSPVAAVAFDQVGKRLAAGSDDAVVKIWDAATGTELLTLPTLHEAPVSWVEFSPDGKHLATAAQDETAKVWDLATGKELFKVVTTFTSYAVSFSPDGKYIVTSTFGAPQLWDANTGAEVGAFSGPSGDTSPARFTADGKYLVASQEKAYIWDIAKRELFSSFAIGSSGDIGAALSPGCVAPPEAPFEWCGVYLATSNRDKTIKLWDITPLGNRELMSVPGVWHCLNPDATHLTSYTYDPLAVEIHQAPPWQIPAQTSFLEPSPLFPPSSQTLFSLQGGVAFSKDCTRGATVNYDDLTVTIFDVTTGKDLLTFKLPEGTKRSGRLITTIDFSPDGTRLATEGPNNTVKIWDVNMGKELLTLTGHSDGVRWIRYSRDGKMLATSSADDTAKVWDAETGKELVTLRHPNVTGIAFNADGTRLATGSLEGIVKIWDVKTGAELFNLTGHTASVWALAFSPDGTRLATGGGEGTGIIWDTKTGERLMNLSFPAAVRSAVSQMTFADDGKRLVTSLMFGDRTHIYLTNVQDLYALAQSRVTRTLTAEECQQYLHVEQCPQQR